MKTPKDIMKELGLDKEILPIYYPIISRIAEKYHAQFTVIPVGERKSKEEILPCGQKLCINPHEKLYRGCDICKYKTKYAAQSEGVCECRLNFDKNLYEMECGVNLTTIIFDCGTHYKYCPQCGKLIKRITP